MKLDIISATAIVEAERKIAGLFSLLGVRQTNHVRQPRPDAWWKPGEHVHRHRVGFSGQRCEICGMSQFEWCGRRGRLLIESKAADVPTVER